MPRRLALAATPLVLAAALVGCSEQTRIPPAEPPAAQAPLFASDEEALAAATAAYEEYLAVVDAALADPIQGSEFERVAVGEALTEIEQSLKEFTEEGYVLVGRRSLGDSSIQQVFVDGEVTTVVAYLCEDLTEVLLLDGEDVVITTADRPNFTVFEVTVEFRDDVEFVSARRFWENAESC